MSAQPQIHSPLACELHGRNLNRIKRRPRNARRSPQERGPVPQPRQKRDGGVTNRSVLSVLSAYKIVCTFTKNVSETPSDLAYLQQFHELATHFRGLV
jgi:hypothetical protein